MAVALFVKPPAPAGLPVATQNLNINFGSGDVRNGTYVKTGAAWTNFNYSGYHSLVPPNFNYNNNQTWTFWNSDQSEPVDPSNPSTDPNYIPTTGWSPSITITTAGSGLSVAMTSSIIVNGETYTAGGSYGISYQIYRGELGDEYFGCITDCSSNSIQDAIVYRDGSWKFDRNWLNNGFYGAYSYVSSTNPSSNPAIIPTTGWSPSITITAA